MKPNKKLGILKTDEQAYDPPFYCRCGGLAVRRSHRFTPVCSLNPDGDVRHDIVSQVFSAYMNMPNWSVVEKDGKFLAYAGMDLHDTDFDTEEEAWEYLNKEMWSDEVEEEYLDTEEEDV